MYLLMMSLLLCRRRGEGVRKLAKSCRRHLWTAPYGNQNVGQYFRTPFDEDTLTTLHIFILPTFRVVLIAFGLARNTLV